MEYVVEVPKYSHAGSGFTREHSRFPTREQAEKAAEILRAHPWYRFVTVEEVKTTARRA